jgi:hypothetical protein
MKIVTITPSFRYSGVAYTEQIRKYRTFDTITSAYKTSVDTLKRLSYGHAYYPSLSFALSPKIYGMYNFRPGSKVQAIRHVMSPSASFTYIPDVSNITPEYYRELYDENGKLLEKYSIFGNGIYGTPTLGRQVRTMSLRLNNTVEAKVWNSSDTVQEARKVSLLDNLSFNTNLDFDDSIKFDPVTFNGNTRLFKDKLNITFRGAFDPYGEALNEQNRYVRVNKSEFSQSGKLMRLTNFGLSTGMSFKGGESKTREMTTGQEPPPPPDDPLAVRDEYDRLNEDLYGEYVDFSVPWSIQVDYSFDYTLQQKKAQFIQTMRLTGDFSLTPKWKIGYNTGYDFKSKQVTTSSLSIYRDLHCWEMTLSAVPFGLYKSFNFTINAKSSILHDLKYNKRIPWQDNF